MPTDAPWWKTGVFYQIYPRSFMDANADGVGDLPGILQRLDHLAGTPESLGVDGLWISPCFVSPMADFGYDVADYTKIDPLFGTNEDMDCLIAGAHQRGIKVLLDFVPNHTSDQHPWFAASRSSRESPQRDWYVWRDGRGPGRPPNNWVAAFGGSAWRWEPATSQWYLHSFLEEQPDLNWRNPAVQEAMFGALRFWLDRGIDGFRIDAIHYLIKDEQLRDNPTRPHVVPFLRQRHEHDMDQPEVHGLLRELRLLLDSYPGDRMAVGETFLFDPARVAQYYGTGNDELHLAFNFRLLFCLWSARSFMKVVTQSEGLLPAGAWPVWVLSNHDQTRHITRYGHLGRAERRARIAAAMLLTLRGTPFLYYGEEIGLRSHRVPKDRLVDPPGKRYWPVYGGRDVARTPMQWEAKPGGGFSTAEPWLPFPADAQQITVEAQQRDPGSLLALYRALIRLRKAHPALQLGSFTALPGAGSWGMAYRREVPGQRLLVVLNLGRLRRRYALSQAGAGRARLLFSTEPDRPVGEESATSLHLGPEEGLVLEV
ncbi:MAG: alpha-amylase family glycosyl hydrolase [Myxococcota bacterium]|jgi:alpha-glucosidase|nr:alpha-amylase family glycosyl hydrolase [Myxococcota bacterium]